MLSVEIDLDDRLLADFIVQGRKNHKLTQEMLAEKIGVDWRTVQRWEAGESFPWPSHIDALSAIMPEMKRSFEDVIQKKLTFIQIHKCICVALPGFQKASLIVQWIYRRLVFWRTG